MNWKVVTGQGRGTGHHLHPGVIHQNLGQHYDHASLDDVDGPHGHTGFGANVSEDVGRAAVVIANIADILGQDIARE